MSTESSDEVGIFDMCSGQLVDLMTHEGPVAAFSVTSNGAFMVVALQHARLGQFNKVGHSTQFTLFSFLSQTVLSLALVQYCTIGHFLLVVLWNQAPVSNGFRDIQRWSITQW